MQLQQQEKPFVRPVPTITIPSGIDQDFKDRLRKLKNGKVVVQQDHPYIDVGENTFILLHDARTIHAEIAAGSLVARLGDLAKRCEYPVLLLVGNMFGKGPIDVGRSRSVAGFITHLELFTRIRTLQSPDRFHAVMMIQLLAKQAQLGFQSSGLEDL